MSEILKANAEQEQNNKRVTGWNNLADPNESWEDHLERARKSNEAYMDGLLESTLNDIQESIANDISNIMELESESEANKTDSTIRYGFHYARQKHESVIRNERVREEIEKDLNQRLVKVENLEELADIDGMGVSSSEIDYYDKKIDILNIDLNTYQGPPLNLLTHSIDFKQTKMHQVVGQGTSNALRVLPNLWLQRQDQTKFITNNYNSRSNVIFTSYSNPKNPNSVSVDGDIIYGFDHVDADSLLKLASRDGNTPLILDYRLNAPSEEDLDFFDEVENGASNGSYNEVAFRRYDETGKPKIPDYLLTYNGIISEDAKNHASTFNIPIINLTK